MHIYVSVVRLLVDGGSVGGGSVGGGGEVGSSCEVGGCDATLELNPNSTGRGQS
jgi:hypothetical protein